MARQNKFMGNKSPRMQYNESNFTGGMYIDKSYATEGLNYHLVNYAIDSDFGYLTPRAGIRCDDIVLHNSGDLAEHATFSKEPKVLVDSTETGEADGTHYLQVITRAKELENSNINNLKRGPLYAYTTATEGSVLAYEAHNYRHIMIEHPEYTLPEEELFPSIRSRGSWLRRLAFSADEESPLAEDALFKKPDAYSIHGMESVDTNYLARNVGTFWNNNYYFFGTDKQLYQTKLLNAKYSISSEASSETGELKSTEGSLYRLHKLDNRVDTLPVNQTTGFLELPETSASSVNHSDFLRLPLDSGLYIEVLNDTTYRQYTGREDTTATYMLRTVSEEGNGEPAYAAPAPLPKKTLTINEASSVGYNMLSDAPYDFENDPAGNTDTFQITGILPYSAEKQEEIKTRPKVGEEIIFKVFYAISTGKWNTKFKYTFEWQPVGSSDWTELKTDTAYVTKNSAAAIRQDPIKIPVFAAPSQNFLVRCRVWQYETDTKVAAISDHTFVAGFNFDGGTVDSTAGGELRQYDIAASGGMCYWNHRLIVWDTPPRDGLDDSRNMIFASYPDDPTWFPYPLSAEVFDEPVMHCVEYMDTLLVFTRTKLWQLTMADDGWTWSKLIIQQNLNISADDVHLIKAIKSMLFFKSGNRYYLVVPGQTSSLAIAPISNNIASLLDNFEKHLRVILASTHDYKGPDPMHPDRDLPKLDFITVDAYLDYNAIHVRYLFDTEHDKLNVDLIYNTDTRAWSLELFESQRPVRQHNENVTQQGNLIGLFNEIDDTTGIQVLHYDNKLVDDFYIKDGFDATPKQEHPKYLGLKGTSIDVYRVFKKFWSNYQLLDTGYRDLNTDIFKRFREVQLKMQNHQKQNLNFATEFEVDGVIRKARYEYATEVKDSEDGEYQELVVTTYEKPQSVLPGETSLGQGVVNDTGTINPETDRETYPQLWQQGGPWSNPLRHNTSIVPHQINQEKDFWTLDKSGFLDQTHWKLRVKVGNARGVSPRFRLVSKNEKLYTLTSYIWVYRTLGSRGKYNGNVY